MAKKKKKTATRRQRPKKGSEPRKKKRAPRRATPKPKPKKSRREEQRLFEERSRRSKAAWKRKKAEEAKEAAREAQKKARALARKRERARERERERRRLAREAEDKAQLERAAEVERQKKRREREKKRRADKRYGKPSAALVALFQSKSFYYSGYLIFDDGVEEGQIMVAAGRDPIATLIQLEAATAPTIEKEPVWVQVGLRARNAAGRNVRLPDPEERSLPDSPKRKDLENYTGYVEEWSKPHDARKTRLAFVVGRVISENMISFGDRVEFLMVRVTFGPKPE